MKLTKYITALVIAILIQSTVYAVDLTTTVPYVKYRGRTLKATIVDNYDLGGDASTTKVYNEEEGVDLSDGAINVSGYKSIGYHVDLKTLGSTTVTLTFYGKRDEDFSVATGGWMLLWTKAFTATDTGYSFEPQETGLLYVRVGMESDDGGTDDLSIDMNAVRDK